METQLSLYVGAENVRVLILFMGVARLEPDACCKGKLCDDIEAFLSGADLQGVADGLITSRGLRLLNVPTIFVTVPPCFRLRAWRLDCLPHLIKELLIWRSTTCIWNYLAALTEWLQFPPLIVKLFLDVNFIGRSRRLLLWYSLYLIKHDLVVGVDLLLLYFLV